MASVSSARRPGRRWAVSIHRWLGLAAALVWLLQAVTGVLLSFHFEIGDAALSTAHRPTDLAALERRLDELATAGPEARVNYIWTTAGLEDRYVINYVDGEGVSRRMRVDGAGDILRDRRLSDHTFLTFVRELHLNLVAGQAGHWILAVAGVLLATNLVFGAVVAWPRRGAWRRSLKPASGGDGVVTAYSWHRALGLWLVAPAVVVVVTGTLIFFEHPIERLVGTESVTLPPNPPQGEGIGFEAMAIAAAEAIPGSYFVGSPLPSDEDASYYAWVRAPGELYHNGYGGSLVIVDANDGSIRGAYPATEHGAAKAFLYSLYPLHTGEAGGMVGRVLVMIVGIGLTAVTVFGFLLWLRRRDARRVTR